MNLLKGVYKFFAGDTVASMTAAAQKRQAEMADYLGGAADKFKDTSIFQSGTVPFDEFRSVLRSGNQTQIEDFVTNNPSAKGLVDELYGAENKPVPMYTDETLSAMARNFEETGEVGLGITARETIGTSRPLRMLGSSNTFAGGTGALALGGLLGAGAAAATGNDQFSGAVAGGLSVLGTRAIGKALTENVGGIESYMMKKVLGDDMVTREALEEAVASKDVNRMNKILQDTGADNTINQTRVLYEPDKLLSDVPELKAGSLRRSNLQAVQARDPDSLSGMQGAMQTMLTKNKGIGIQTRYLVGSGALLSGMAFSSPRKDRSRGFNRNRGNRF